MMNNKKELEIIRNNYDNMDKYTPKGYLFCYDDSGNLLFHTHNMIVKSGREKIFNTLVAASGNTALNLNNLKAYLGNSLDLVKAEDNIESLGSLSNKLDLDSCEKDNTNLITKFTITYDSADSGHLNNYISTLGLVFEENSQDILFSRVIFPQYSSSTDKLKFSYYLYF